MPRFLLKGSCPRMGLSPPRDGFIIIYSIKNVLRSPVSGCVPQKEWNQRMQPLLDWEPLNRQAFLDKSEVFMGTFTRFVGCKISCLLFYYNTIYSK